MAMSQTAASSCPNCQRLHQQVQALQELAARQQQAIAALTEQVRALQEKLAAAGKDSSTSSKPPSSDIVKPPKPAPPPGQDRRKPGGQPGHPKHQRAAFPEGEGNGGSFDHVRPCCPDCGHAVVPLDGPARVAQQMDVRLPAVVVTQHRGHPAWCPHCLKVHYAALPAAVATGGLVGPNLTVLIAYLKGVCHASFATVRKFLRDIAGVTIARGQLAKVIAKVSEALAGPYDDLLAALPAEAVLNVDETGHNDQGQALWTWCFRASLYTLFRIDPRRSADVLIDVLGQEFDGVLGCDHFSAYRRYMRQFDVRLQFCLAHLIRDVKFLTTLPSLEEVIYGTRLLLALKELFAVIHRRAELSTAELDQQLAQARQAILRAGAMAVPQSGPCQVMAKRLEKYGAAYFTFVTTPGLGPTNNLAEQAIRFVVLDRHVTQGTRGETGQRFCERIWSVIATCAQQGRSVWDYLQQAVARHWAGEAVPSLLPAKA
jgi:transposase